MSQLEADSPNASPPEVTLLTGVTGFVGKRLLGELLQQTSATIICLVRATNDLEAQRRGKAVSGDLRVVYLAADLEQRKFGLSERAWQALAERIHEIYHCAASVSFDLPLQASRRINVFGTAELLNLANKAMRNGQFRRMHHVSTAYVAGTKRGPVTSDYLPDFRNSKRFRNPYEQSKAEAEALLRNQTFVPATIYRPSIVAGNTANGETDNFNVLYVPIRLIHRGAMPFLPASRTNTIDCVGIDYVARGIVALGKQSAGQCDSYHLTAGEDSFRVEDLVRIANEESNRDNDTLGADCEVINRLRWKLLRSFSALAQRAPQRYRSLRRWGKLVTRGMQKFSPYEPYTEVTTTFVCAAEDRLLVAANIHKPPPLEYLRSITRFAMSVDFGAAMQRVSEARVAAAPVLEKYPLSQASPKVDELEQLPTASLPV